MEGFGTIFIHISNYSCIIKNFTPNALLMSECNAFLRITRSSYRARALVKLCNREIAQSCDCVFGMKFSK